MAGFTTHIVAREQTPQLRSQLNILAAKAVETVNKQMSIGGGGAGSA